MRSIRDLPEWKECDRVWRECGEPIPCHDAKYLEARKKLGIAVKKSLSHEAN